MRTCGCCGSENTLIRRRRGWHCTVCHSREAQPSPSPEEIEALKRSLRYGTASPMDEHEHGQTL